MGTHTLAPQESPGQQEQSTRWSQISDWPELKPPEISSHAQVASGLQPAPVVIR